MTDEKLYVCLLCDKHYSSYMGLWKHKKSKHNENIITENKIKNNITCKYCKKHFIILKIDGDTKNKNAVSIK